MAETRHVDIQFRKGLEAASKLTELYAEASGTVHFMIEKSLTRENGGRIYRELVNFTNALGYFLQIQMPINFYECVMHAPEIYKKVDCDYDNIASRIGRLANGKPEDSLEILIL